jgi:phospholipid transport system substrate-binding protein
MKVSINMRTLMMLVALLGLKFSPVAFAQQAPTPKAVVDEFHAALLASMKTGKSTGFAGRQKLLDPVVRKTFDLPLMTRIVVGPAWQSMPPKEQTAVAAAFSNWAVASYAGRFSDFDGEQFITGDTSDGGRGTVQVKSLIKPRGEAPTVLTYRIKSGKIVDVYLDGSVSQLASWRSEFASVLQKQGTAGLIARMNQLTVDFSKKN